MASTPSIFYINLYSGMTMQVFTLLINHIIFEKDTEKVEWSSIVKAQKKGKLMQTEKCACFL